MNLTNEQLAELTACLNARLAEFDEDTGPYLFERLSRGQVRLLYDVIREWQCGQQPDGAAAETMLTKLPAIEPSHTREARIVISPMRHLPEPVIETATVAVATNGNGHHPEPKKDADPTAQELPAGRGGNVLPDLPALVREVQRQAMGNVAPTQAVFNSSKPASWATATAHLQRLGITWADLIHEAGLKPNPRGSGKG